MNGANPYVSRSVTSFPYSDERQNEQLSETWNASWNSSNKQSNKPKYADSAYATWLRTLEDHESNAKVTSKNLE